VDALDGEIRNCESRLRLRRGVLNERFAQLVCGSPEFCSLLAELGAAYGKVRGLLKAMGTIQHALAGSMPGVLSSVWQQAVPLNPEIIDYPTDDGPSDTSLISC